jgi:uracil-DNA glycosylase family 4
MSTYVPGYGSSTAKLMAIGEAPSYSEVESGRPFTGPAGQILNDWLYANDISRDEIYTTNVCKYQLPNSSWANFKQSGFDLNKLHSELWDEIRTIRPNCILALGERALNAVTGLKKITRWRGSILPSINGLPKVVSTFHPAAFLWSRDSDTEVHAKYSYYHICKLDVGRALEESLTRDLTLPHRNLQIAENAQQVISYFEARRGKPRCAIDIEAIAGGSCPSMIGFSFHRGEGFTIPLVNTLKNFKFSNITDTDLTLIWRAVQEILGNPDLEKIGLNLKYDEEKLNDLGFRIRGKIQDLYLLGSTIEPEYPSKGQAFFCSVYTREPYYKDDYRDFDPKKDDIKKVLLYNAKDASTEFEEFEEMWKELEEDPILKKFYELLPQRLHKFYKEVEAVGFDFDLAYRDEVLAPKYKMLIQEAEKDLYKIAGHQFNTGSWQQVAKVMYEELKIPGRTGTDEDTIYGLLANTIKNENQRSFCERLLDVRRLKKAKSTSIDIKLDFDGKLRTSYNSCGTETGRSSTSKPDAPIRPFLSGLAFHTIPKRGQGKDIRKAIRPHKGCYIIELDYKNAEGWITAHLAKDVDLLEFMTLGGDAHRLRASWFYDKKLGKTTVKEAVELLKKKDPLVLMKDVDSLERYVGKKGGHGGNYGEGKHTLMVSTMTESRKNGIDLRLSEWKCGQILDKFHQYSPNVRAIYHEEVRAHIDESRTLYNPFGRRRRFLGRDDEALYREGYATIPQGTVPDALRLACLRAQEKDKDLMFCLEWHDSICFQSPKSIWEEQAKLLKTELEKPIDFSSCSLSRGLLSIPVEVVLYEHDWYEGKEVEL